MSLFSFLRYLIVQRGQLVFFKKIEVQLTHTFMLVSCVQYSNLIFLQIIFPKVIIKYWPYSLFCTLHPCNLLILFLVVFNLLFPFTYFESENHSVMSDSSRPHGIHSPWNSPGQNTGVGSLSLLQGIFLTQELNWGLLHCFPGGSEGKTSSCNAGDPGSIPGLERSPGERNGNPLQYSCLENPWMEEPGRLQSMWSQRVGHRLSDFTFPFLLHCRQILHQLSYEGNTYFTPAPSLFPLVTTSLVFVSMSLFCFAQFLDTTCM